MPSTTHIEQLAHISQFNTERGQPTCHPLVTVLDQQLSQPFMPTRYLSELYIVFLKAAHCERLVYGAGKYTFTADSLLFIAPGQVLHHHSEDIYRPHGWALAFHPDLTAKHNVSLSSFPMFGYHANEAINVSQPDKEQIIQLFRLLKAEADLFATQSHSDTVIAKYIELIMHCCDKLYKQQVQAANYKPSDFLAKFEQALNTYFSNTGNAPEGIPTVQYFADAMHLSANYFGDRIKKETGISAKAFIENWLTGVAKQKIAGSGLSVSQIAYELGFSHPQHFTRFFKRNVGISPTQYR